MFSFLTKNRKGFTLVELLVVLVLLSFGVLALANMFKVTYRAYQKSEERSKKQEAVKYVAECLQKGSAGVSAAQTADIFNDVDVVPTKDATDRSYSYLYCVPHNSCSKCKGDWNSSTNSCSKNIDPNAETPACDGTKGEVDGYYVCVQNKGQNRASAIRLSDVPIYINIKAYTTPKKELDENGNIIETDELDYHSGMTVTLAALEDDFDYEKKDSVTEEITYNEPVSDDIYYSLDVQYHFPNMATSETGIKINHTADGQRAKANEYSEDGKLIEDSIIEATDVGKVLRVYCDSIVGADANNADGTLPTMCFIATASYGHDSGEVGLLCKFRDECLLTNPLGTAFVKAYYKLSPPIADFIRESEPLKAAVRFGLKPLVAIATNALDEDAAAQNAPWFIMFMLCGAGATATLIKVDKRRKKAR